MDTTSPATWLITGASDGLGRALARQALSQGDFVVATFRREEDAAAFRSEQTERACALLLDVTDPASVQHALQAALRFTGRLDRVVNNAGAGVLAPLETTSDADLEAMWSVNVLGPLRILRAALPALREQRSGHLITISAIAAVIPEPGFVAYGSAKAALCAATEALALEVAPFGLRVTTVLPGPFRTPFLSRSVTLRPSPEAYAGSVGKFGGVLQRINGRQAGDPAKAAQAICAIAGRADAPLWLPLGKYAYDQIRRRFEARRAELEAWQPIGLPTDYGAG